MKQYILHKINEFTYSLKINGDNNDLLYSSIQQIVNNSHIDFENNQIIFNAEKIQTFKQYLISQKQKQISHFNCIKLIYCLTTQIEYLHTLGFGFYGFDINDILTIDDMFICCNTYFLSPIYNDLFIFTSPIKKPYFSEPELYKLTSLPFEIHHKCSYYSLGLFIIYSLNANLLVCKEIKSAEEIDKIIQPLYNTKIYWFLKRCFNKNTYDRNLLLI